MRKRSRKDDAEGSTTAIAKIVPRPQHQGPHWTRPEDPSVKLHPSLDQALARAGPFLSTVYLDRRIKCFRYPLAGASDKHAITAGLHTRMKSKFFRGTDPEPFSLRLLFFHDRNSGLSFYKASLDAGKKADAALAECVRTQSAPPPPRAHGASPYATAVWQWCQENGYRLVLAQLPVILVAHNLATAGDYFAVHEATGELVLIELKCGFPTEDRIDAFKKDASAESSGPVMNPPLAHVSLTSENRWHLQVLITRMAYERELGIRIDRVQVLNACKTKHVNTDKESYYCRPVNQPEWAKELLIGDRLSVLYDSLSGPKKARKQQRTKK